MATVQEIIDAAQDRTNQAITQANGFVNRLSAIANSSYTFTGATLSPETTISINPGITSNAPTNHATQAEVDQSAAQALLSGIDATLPDAIENTDIVAENISEFSFQPYEPVIPDRPEFVNPQAPTGDVMLDEVNINLGDAPEPVTTTVHEEPNILDPDVIDIGQFLVDVPEVDYLLPSNDFDFVEQEYSSEFRESILATLANDIENGGSGINPDDEQQLFERARDRESVMYQENNTQIARQFAARGFKLPPGAMAGLLAKARDGLNAAMSSVNRDILLRRSELHTQARQFAIQAGTTLENAMLSYHGSVMERSLNVARLAAQFGIEYHNLQVKQFADRLQQYVAHSQVKTQWVDNAIKKTKEYELKLAKMDLIDKRNARRTDLMNAMNQAVRIAEDIRKTELEIGSFKLENNKLRIEQSKLLTQNYAEIMRSNDVAARAYGEAIRAETLRNEPFKLRLEAHKEERETALAKLKMQEVHKDTQINVQTANLRRREQLLDRYYKELDNSIRKASETSRLLGFDLEGWKMQMQAQEATKRLDLDQQKAKASSVLDTYRADIRNYEYSLNAVKLSLDTTIKAADSGMGLYKDLIMGAQSALGTISVLTEEA